MVYLRFFKSDDKQIINFSDDILTLSTYLYDISKDRINDTEPLPLLHADIEKFNIFTKWFNVLKRYEIIYFDSFKYGNVIFKPLIFKDYDLKTLIELFNFAFYNHFKLLCETLAYVIAGKNISITNKSINDIKAHDSLIIMVLKYMSRDSFNKQPEEIKKLATAKCETRPFEYNHLIINSKTCVYNENTFMAQTNEPDKNICLVPYGVSRIKPLSFFSIDNLKRVILPESLITICESAFNNCHSLEYIEIPDSVTHLLNKAFYGCDKLKTVKISNSLTHIGDFCFKDCRNLENIYYITDKLYNHSLPDTCVNIGSSAFETCFKLELRSKNAIERVPETVTSYSIPENITCINKLAFFGCSKLDKIVIPKSVKNILSTSFKNCYVLNNVVLEGDTDIEDLAFVGCDRLTLINKDKLIKADTLAFNFTIPDGIKIIYKSAFEYCVNLSRIDIPDSVEIINDSAFKNCSKLIRVKMSKNIKRIGFSVFENCEQLKDFDLSTPEFIGDDAFKNTDISDKFKKNIIKTYGESVINGTDYDMHLWKK